MRKFSSLFCLLLMLCMGNFELVAQNSYTTMGAQTGQVGTPGGGGIQVLAPGPNLNVFNSQAAFDAASVGATLTMEDFENSNIADNNVCGDVPPLGSTTADGCFSAGGVSPGFELDVTVNGGSGDYVVLTTGFAGVINDAVGPSSFADHARFNFNPTVTAANFNLILPGGIDTYEVEVFNGATSLGTFDVVSNGNTPVFGGFTTNNNTPITHFTTTAANGTGELFTDLAFGQLAVVAPPAPPAPVEPIPTMSQWGLMIFGLLVLNLGLIFIYKQQNILS